MQRGCTRLKRDVAGGSPVKGWHPHASPGHSPKPLPRLPLLSNPGRSTRRTLQLNAASTQTTTSVTTSEQTSHDDGLEPVVPAVVSSTASSGVEVVVDSEGGLAADTSRQPDTVVQVESANFREAVSEVVSELQFQPREEGESTEAGGGSGTGGAGEPQAPGSGGLSSDGVAPASAVAQVIHDEALRNAFLAADQSIGVETQNNIMSALSGLQVGGQPDSTVPVTVELQAAGPSGLFRGSFLANRDDVLRVAPALLTPAFSAPMQQPGCFFVHATTSEVLKELLRFVRMKGKQAAKWQPVTEDPQVLRELKQVAMELELDLLAELVQSPSRSAQAPALSPASPPGSPGLPGPTNTFVNELLVTGRHMKFQTQLEEMVERDNVEEVWASCSPSWINVPVPALMGVTRRNRFDVVEGVLQLMHREISNTMHDFLTTHHPSPVPVTIIGPPGFGKSHSLFEAVCRLKSQPSNRVVYIPDCQGWACEAGNGPLEYLLEAVVCAFARDEEVLQHCLACHMDEDSVSKLLKWLPEYCTAKGLQLYAIFDGHSGLTTEQRQTMFPLNIAENLLAVSAEWKTCSVVICGSASYNYKLIGNQDGSWPLFDFCQGLNDEEFDAWVRFKRLPVPTRFKGRVKFETSSIPLELSFLLQTFNQSSSSTRSIPNALQAYRVLRAEALTEQQYTFSRECLWKLIDEDAAIAAITAMHLKLGLRGASQALEPNLSLMYKAWIKVAEDGSQKIVSAASEATFRGLLPTTPLAAQVLTTYWGQRAVEHQLATIQEVFTSDLYDAREKGMALQRHFESNLRARMHLDLVGYVISATRDKHDWAEVVFAMDDIRLVTLEYGEVVPMCEVDWKRGTIFRPACRMSAGPDYVLWSPDRRELLALRVTTLPLYKKIGKWRDFTDTPVPQSEGEELLPAYKQWELRLAEDLGEGNFKICPGWLTTNLEASEEFDSHYVFPHIMLEQRQFPLMDLLPSRGFR